MERGYEDTYRQFIEPFLGASGERIRSQLGRQPVSPTRILASDERHVP